MYRPRFFSSFVFGLFQNFCLFALFFFMALYIGREAEADPSFHSDVF